MKLTHYWYHFLQCAPGLHLLPPGLVGSIGAVENIWSFRAVYVCADCVLLLWQNTQSWWPLPLCETPTLYRAAWCIYPPAVHICHGGCPEHRPGRSKPQKKCRVVLSNITEGWTDSPRVSQLQQENCGVSCSPVEPAKGTQPTIRTLAHTQRELRSILPSNRNSCVLTLTCPSRRTLCSTWQNFQLRTELLARGRPRA